MKKYFLGLTLYLIMLPVFAAAQLWNIVPNESTITFTGTQNGAPVSGQFKKFTGEIHFDPNQLSASEVKIIVDTNSIATSYIDLTNTLLTPDWFNTKVFPQATFSAKHFSKLSPNTYQAEGTLTIRDKTQPIILTFTVLEQTNDSAKVKGSTVLKRLNFGIGQGEWASTDEVKNDVTVDFELTAKK